MGLPDDSQPWLASISGGNQYHGTHSHTYASHLNNCCINLLGNTVYKFINERHPLYTLCSSCYSKHHEDQHTLRRITWFHATVTLSKLPRALPCRECGKILGIAQSGFICKMCMTNLRDYGYEECERLDYGVQVSKVKSN